MLTSYGFFAGTELWNHERLTSYMVGDVATGFRGLRNQNTSVGPNCFCPTAHDLYCDQGEGTAGAYTSPAADNAPWYDPNVPESAEFAGLFVEDVTGFDGTVARDVSDGAISGSSLGPLRLKGRSITVTGWLCSKTCCGAEYGLRWLQEALLGADSCVGCQTSDLYMIKCCPPEGGCYVSEVSKTAMQDQYVQISITDMGSGLFDIRILDDTRANVVSTLAGAANNILGIAPVAFAGTNTWKLTFIENTGDLVTWLIEVPWPIITNFATAPNGVGAEATITVDTTATSTCLAQQQQIDTLTALIARWILQFGDGVLTPVLPFGSGTTTEILEGVNPLDYIRLFHRTGLADGVKVVDRQGSCCATCGCTNLKVQFTLTSELPYIFSDISWCADTLSFPADEYCINLNRLCGQCSTPVGTKSYARQVPRPTCNITLRHNQTWCADGWDVGSGCPPPECSLVVGGTTEFTPPAAAAPVDLDVCSADSGGSTAPNICEVALNGYPTGTWGEYGGWSVADGFPPKYCDLTVFGGGVCAEAIAHVDAIPAHDAVPEVPEVLAVPAEIPCLISVTYNKCTGAKTWTPIRWDGILPAGECPCIQIAETCIISCPAEVVPDVVPDCVIPHECLINVNCDGSWQPLGWAFDQNAAFPDPGCTYIISTVNGSAQDTSPLTEYVSVPADDFVADCGPILIPPPAPFLITSDCFCEPWTTRRLCCSFTNPGDWNDATTYLEIYTGASAMRRLKIEAYQNPFGDNLPCACDPNDEFWACREPCASIVIPQLPASAKLVIDSRLHLAQLTLNNGKTVNAMRYLFTSDGNPFNWFDVGQCATFCMVASVDTLFVANDATISIGMVTRYLASGW